MRELVVDLVRAKQVATEKLCIGSTCVTETELQALLRNANISPASPLDQTATTTGDGAAATSTSSGGLSITLIGNNPAEINVGDSFIDPGALATDANGAPLMPDIFENTVDTSASGEYHVIWVVHDGAMNFATSTRIVKVVDPFTPLVEATTTPPLIEEATSTPPIVEEPAGDAVAPEETPPVEPPAEPVVPAEEPTSDNQATTTDSN